jgi:hypothetical protein
MKLQWNFLKCPKKRMDFSESVDALISETESTNLSIDTISSIIQKAALFSQERGKRKHSDWFSDNETDLFDAINHRNEAYNKSTEDPSNSTLKQELRERRKVLRNLIKSSKDKWLNDKARRVANKLQLNAKGGNAWQAIKEINAGTTGHQLKLRTMRMHKDCGNLTVSDSENADHMRGYYHEHFNSTEAPVPISDATRRLRHRTKRLHLGTTPTPQAVINVIVSLPSKKSLGESQIIAEALKALSPEALATIADAIIAY